MVYLMPVHIGWSRDWKGGAELLYRATTNISSQVRLHRPIVPELRIICGENYKNATAHRRRFSRAVHFLGAFPFL